MGVRQLIDQTCPVCASVRKIDKHHLRGPVFTGMCMPCSRASRRGENHPLWKGGSYINGQGYRLVVSRDHPNAYKHGYVLEHRLVMEEKLGRYLTKVETVHHKDGDRQNNSLDNLELWGTRHGKGQRVSSFIVDENLEWIDMW